MQTAISNGSLQSFDTVVVPVQEYERISSIDALRGFALLGILLMNIPVFGLSESSYLNPYVTGGSGRYNVLTWITAYTLFEGKMRAIFSMMFGASACLLVDRLTRKGAALEAADIHYRRMLWLITFGLIHAYIIWNGDVLYYYGVLGLLLYPLRNLSPKWLLIGAAGLMLCIPAYQTARYFHVLYLRQAYMQTEADYKAGKKLTSHQEKARSDWNELVRKYTLDPAELRTEEEAHRGGYLSMLRFRRSGVYNMHSAPIYGHIWLDMLDMMLIGMAFLKLDVLTAKRSTRFYLLMAALGFGIGIPSHLAPALFAVRHGSTIESIHIQFITYEFGRFTAFGYCALFLLAYKAGLLRKLMARLAAVGRMAFSNYILTSIICVMIFDGYGLGLFDKLQRWELYPIVLAVWAVQLVVSPLWLRYFRFGPLEWLWRSLTYCRKQPMAVRTQPELATAAPG